MAFCTKCGNRIGDEHGATYDPSTASVATAPGWRDAYQQYVDAGWASVPYPEQLGGGAFPWLLGLDGMPYWSFLTFTQNFYSAELGTSGEAKW